MSTTYTSTMVLNKTADTPVVVPVVKEYPSARTFTFQILAQSMIEPIYQINFLGVPNAGSAFPDESLELWWNKDVADSLPLYKLRASFSGIEASDVFLASNCLRIQETGEAETACGNDYYDFGYVPHDTAQLFKMRVVPSAAYIAENPTLTIIKMSFQNWENPVVYGSRNEYPLFVGGDRSLLAQASIDYSVLLLISLSTAYLSETSVSSGYNWSVSKS